MLGGIDGPAADRVLFIGDSVILLIRKCDLARYCELPEGLPDGQPSLTVPTISTCDQRLLLWIATIEAMVANESQAQPFEVAF